MEHDATVRDEQGAWRVLVACLAVAVALLLPLANPGSGTGVNLQQADDAAALVVGDHHAKTMPAESGVVLVLLACTAAVLLRAVRAARPAIVAWAGGWDLERSRATRPAAVLAAGGGARRAPPARLA